ncbi:MAG: iron-containing alcohol dehydrogenase [Spirochaetales bacterium]|nr:iron-containing alcohol dehydrogenase [Spirochaetales bacterium]
MNEMRKFLCPEFVFGSGAVSLAGRYAEHMGASKVLLVTDPGVRDAGWTAAVQASLEERDISYELYDAILPNPRDTQVMEGSAFYEEQNCDVILAVGGGSVLDAAKGIGIVAANGGHILDYEGVDAIPEPIPPLICIPTTCGSSADVSQFAIITDTKGHRKIAIISKSVVPDIALIDPDTLETMSHELMAAVCLDTLTHSIEAYVSQAHSFMTDRHALGAIELVGEHLIPALSHREDRTLQAYMMQASLEAGLAFSNASLGLVHAMAHVLGGLKDFPHGICNGLLLQNVCSYNYDACPERYDRITKALRGSCDDIHGKESLVEALAILVEGSGVREELGKFKLSSPECRTLAQMSLKDACIVTNPREPELKEIVSLYEETFTVR